MILKIVLIFFLIEENTKQKNTKKSVSFLCLFLLSTVSKLFFIIKANVKNKISEMQLFYKKYYNL